jgi:hypothetical protein
MSFLSSLFQTGAPVQQVAGPTVQSSQLPKELAPYYKDILGKAQALYNERTKEGFQPYQGPTIADFTPEQQQAFTGLQGLVGSQAPVFQEGMDLTRSAAAPMTSEQMTQYMSPYQQAVTDIEKREATKQYESQVVPQLAAKAATTGGFGGSRQAILEGMAADTQQRLLSDIQAKGSQQAYQDAVKRFQADRQAAGQAGAQLATMAPAQFKAQLGELGAIQTVGEQKQRQQQTALDEAFRQYTLERNYPYDTMSKYQSVVTGAPVQQTTFAQPTPPPPSTAQTLISGLGTLGATYGAFTGQNPLSLLTGRKHGGGLSDLPVVNADNGGLLQRLIDRYRFSNRAADAFPMENRGEGASMFPLTKGVPVQIDEEVGKMYDKYGNIFNLPDRLPNIGEDVDASSLEDLSTVAGVENDGITRFRSIDNIFPEDVNTQDPLLTFDSSQAGRRSSIETVPGNIMVEGSGYQGRDIIGPDRLARVPTNRTTQGYSLDKKDTRTLDEINADIVERQRAKNAQKIQDVPKQNERVINQPPGIAGVEGGLPTLETPTTNLDTAGMSEQIAIQQKEDAIRKAMAAQEGRYDERLKGIEDERTKGQYANLASFFARMGTATPRKGGLLGVVDAALQAAPESIDAMKATDKEFRDRRENLEDKREDIKLISMKEDLGMTLSKRDRRIKSDAVKESKRQFDKLYKIKEEEIKIARETAALPVDIKDAYLNNIQQRPKEFLEDYKGYKSEDGSIIINMRDGSISGTGAQSARNQIRNLKQDIELEILSPPYNGDYNSWMRLGGNSRYDARMRQILGMSQASDSGTSTSSAKIEE